MNVGELSRLLDGIAPYRWAFPFDRVGLLVGTSSQPANRLAVTLDPSVEAVEFCLANGVEALIAHHPIIWDPIAQLGPQEAVVKAVRGGLAVFGFHTNWDAGPGGINDTLAELLELTQIRPIGQSVPLEVVKATFFVPSEDADSVLRAAAAAGAGEIGLYTHCSFQVEGEGTFWGWEGSRPAVGESGRLERVTEKRLEMVVPKDKVAEVKAAIRAVHPYEEPAFDFQALLGWNSPPIARIGALEEGKSLEAFARQVGRNLGLMPEVWGDPHRPVKNIAVCGGAASDEWRSALKEGAEVLVTGEVKQNHAVEALEAGVALIQAGHHQTEHPGMAALGRLLQSKGHDCLIFEPERGRSAKPWQPDMVSS
jgi:dinuclear metal center YbgI/SA1388 family protein